VEHDAMPPRTDPEIATLLTQIATAREALRRIRDLTFVSAFFFAMALAALGLETDLKRLRQRGLRPLFAGILAWVFISAFSFALVQLLPAPHRIG
jgi:uncharacterized membrane protein YadS